MAILTQEKIKGIICDLKGILEENRGVSICMQQESVNLENWIQIELCDILYKKLCCNYHKIEVEKKISPDYKGYVDIRVVNNERVELVIEIKIIKIGNKNSILKDIQKLKGAEIYKDIQKAILCIAYQNHKTKKSWANDYLKDVEDKIGEISEKYDDSFKVNGNNGGKIEVILYLNSWV